jgi:hypothetical protein
MRRPRPPKGLSRHWEEEEEEEEEKITHNLASTT